MVLLGVFDVSLSFYKEVRYIFISKTHIWLYIITGQVKYIFEQFYKSMTFSFVVYFFSLVFIM